MAIIKVITPSVTDANITTAKVTDNAITLAKMASGTDGNIISYDASGNPVAIATGNDGQVLTSTGAGSPPAFETPASATNTPCFFASSSSDQVINNNSTTKLTFSNEVYDVGGVYDPSNYRFTPGFSGKSNISAGLWIYDAQSSIFRVDLRLYKNGSYIVNREQRYTSSNTTVERQSVDFNVTLQHDDNDYYDDI